MPSSFQLPFFAFTLLFITTASAYGVKYVIKRNLFSEVLKEGKDRNQIKEALINDENLKKRVKSYFKK